MDKRVAISFGEAAKARPYSAAVELTGLPWFDAADESLDGAAGLVLSGGVDVNPDLYGAERHPETEESDEERDRLEVGLVREALSRDIPVLAICRGIQVLNVALGGTLVQHLDSGLLSVHRQRGVDHAHEVVVEPGNEVAVIMGAGVHTVNSRHHQALDRVADGLKVVGRSAEDGIIEAAVLEGKRWVVAVQWHPEDRVQYAGDRALFEQFARAVRAQ